MKKEEFNLSKKRQDTNKGTDFVRYAYSEEDVKEFIRLLKEVIQKPYPKHITDITGVRNYYNNQIDKLAGDKLK